MGGTRAGRLRGVRRSGWPVPGRTGRLGMAPAGIILHCPCTPPRSGAMPGASAARWLAPCARRFPWERGWRTSGARLTSAVWCGGSYGIIVAAERRAGIHTHTYVWYIRRVELLYKKKRNPLYRTFPCNMFFNSVPLSSSPVQGAARIKPRQFTLVIGSLHREQSERAGSGGGAGRRTRSTTEKQNPIIEHLVFIKGARVAAVLVTPCARRTIQSSSYEYPLPQPCCSFRGVDGNIHTNWLENNH